jgi:hypothetical protein
MTCSLAYNVARRALLSKFGTVSSDLNDADDDHTMCIFATADGEADGRIRDFIRSRHCKSTQVVLLSDDASLLLGVPAECLYVVDLETISLKAGRTADPASLKAGRTADPVGGSGYSVHATVHHMSDILGRLEVASDPYRHDAQSVARVDEHNLPWIAAILSGESVRRGQYEDPFTLVRFLKDFLVPVGEWVPRHEMTDRQRVLEKLDQLAVVTIFVRAWHPQPDSDFASFIDIVRHYALSLTTVDRYSVALRLFNLRPRPGEFRPAKVSALLSGSSKVLYGFDSKVPRERIQFEGVVHRGARVRACYRGSQTAYDGTLANDGTPEGTFSVKFTAEFVVEDDCPGGLAHPQVAAKMAGEVNKRRDDVMDAGGQRNAIQTKWGTWTDCEPVEESTEVLLSPLQTLNQQIKVARTYAASELHQGGAPTEEPTDPDNPDNPDSPDSPDTPGDTSVDSFNTYLRQKFAGADEREAGLVTIRTEKVVCGSAPTCTLLGLTRISPRPTKGILVSNASDSAGVRVYGMGFRVCTADALDREGAYLRHTHTHSRTHSPPQQLYSSTRKGALFNLTHRRALLERVSAGAGNRTAGAIEQATSTVFQWLALTATVGVPGVTLEVDGLVTSACDSVATFWVLFDSVPSRSGRETARVLLSDQPAVGSARTLFATVHLFAALLAPALRDPHTRHCLRTYRPDDLLPAVTAALLLSPFFSFRACDLKNTAVTLLAADPPCQAVIVDLLGSQKEFALALKEVSGRVVLGGATKGVDRLAQLVECVFSEVTDLLGLGGWSDDDGYEAGCRGATPRPPSAGAATAPATATATSTATSTATVATTATPPLPPPTPTTTAATNTPFDWLDICRWFNLAGVQFVLAHMEAAGSLEACYAHVCAAVGIRPSEDFMEVFVLTVGEVVEAVRRALV